MPWSVVRRLSSVLPSLAFHFFHIFSRIVIGIELKLGGRHYGYMEIQNCSNRSVPISKMATMATDLMAAVLKFFKLRLLPNSKLDWEASV